MKRKLLLLFAAISFGILSPIQAALQVELGDCKKSGSNYVFPDLKVTGGVSDKGYIIRFMFTRPTASGDVITLSTLPGGWSENVSSTQFVRMIDIPSGATISQLQNYLRTVQISFDSNKNGQGIMVLLSENSSDAGRTVFYSSDTKHWYEYVQESKIAPGGAYPYGKPYEWWEAYNRAIDRTFMGMKGYLAVINTAVENNFIFTVSSGKMGWIGGTRGDIRGVLHVDGKHLTGRPSWTSAGDQSGFLDYWYWACGPEYEATKNSSNPKGNPAAAIFYNQKTTSSPAVGIVSYNYSNWGTAPYTQPDNMVNAANSPEGENYLHFGLIGTAQWNDFGVYGFDPDGPLCERTISGSIIEFQGEMIGPNSSGVVGFESSKTATINGTTTNGTSTNPVTILYGEEMTYSIVASNSSATNTSVSIWDQVPMGLEIISISDGGSFNSGTRKITWDLTVPTEQSKTVTYKVKPSTGATNLMINKATVTSSNGNVIRETNSTYYQQKFCTINFAAGTNGTITNGNPQVIEYGQHPRIGVTVTPTIGYKFVGWSYPAYNSLRGIAQAAGSGIMDYTGINVYGSITLTANFELETYKIKYLLNGGTAPAIANPASYTISDLPLAINNQPTKAGYTFIGWTGSNGTTPQTAVNVITGTTGDLEYTANWSTDQYTISYDYNGGIAPATANKASYNITETPFDIVNQPSRNGYTFKGWTGSNGMAPQTTVSVGMGTTGNLAYKAEWEIKKFNILYDLNGGISPIIPNPGIYTINDLPLDIINQPTKNGHTFVGWTNNDNAVPQLTPTIGLGSWMQDTTFYAQWSFQFPKDTLYDCEGPITIESGHDGLSYVWILPDGSSQVTENITAQASGNYILQTNYGGIVTTDTVYVLYIFNHAVKIKRLSNLNARIGENESFTTTLSPLIQNVSYNWSFEGDHIYPSTTDTVNVVFRNVGTKSVSVHITAEIDGVNCEKTLVYDLLLAGGHGFFVDQNVIGGLKNGSSWENAYLTIQEALSHATIGDYIWVASGEYSPDLNSSYLILNDSISIYGGFGAWESYLYERDFSVNPTILKGTGQSVVITSNVNSSTHLDGFIIQGGTAAQGGGIYNNKSSITISNCIIRHNNAEEGGGIYSNLGNPVLYNVEISGNTAFRGAAMYNENANPVLTNVTISGNRATTNESIYKDNLRSLRSTPRSSLIAGGGIYNKKSNPFIRNTIIWGNLNELTPSNIENESSAPIYSSSLIEGSSGSGNNWISSLGTDGGRNFDANPFFTNNGFDKNGNMQIGNYALRISSRAINNGKNAHVYEIQTCQKIHLSTLKDSELTAGFSSDLMGMERIAEDYVDMGAYEAGSIKTDHFVQRDITLPTVDGLSTNPLAGTHHVIGHQNFVFTITAKPGYSLENLYVSTGMDEYDNRGGLQLVRNEDGSVTVTILQVKHSLSIIINGVSPTSSATIEGLNVWSSDNMLHINTDISSTLHVCTMMGQLYLQREIREGMTSICLEKGIYTVSLRGNNYKVIIK